MLAGVRLENKTRRCWIKGEMYNRWLGSLPPFLILGPTLNPSLRWKRSNRGLPLEQNRSDLKSAFDREGWGDAGVLSRPLQLSFQAREVLQRRTSADCQRSLSGLQRKTTWMDATKIPELHHNGFVWMQTRIKSGHPSHTVAVKEVRTWLRDLSGMQNHFARFYVDGNLSAIDIYRCHYNYLLAWRILMNIARQPFCTPRETSLWSQSTEDCLWG